METIPEPAEPQTTTPNDEGVMLSSSEHADRMFIPEGMRPLPEIVLPEDILREREEGINRLLEQPPNVDCILVLARSGTLAASGLYGKNSLIERSGLTPPPPMEAIDGIGNEVFHMWNQYIDDHDLEEESNPTYGLGDDSDDEIRAHFTEWVRRIPNEHIKAVVARLKGIRSTHPDFQKFAILDDIRQSGNVSIGITPALLKTAYQEKYEYAPDQNKYLFQNPSWIENIIRASFGQDMPGLTERQAKFLCEVAKGSTDWPSVGAMELRDTSELASLAEYFDTRHVAREKNTSPDAVRELAGKYGENLLRLHQNLVLALKAHTEDVLQKRVVSGDV